MAETTEAALMTDRRDLLLTLYSLAGVAPNEERALHLGLRAIHRHFAAASAVLARFDPDGRPSGTPRCYPKRPRWSEAELLALREESLADLPRAAIFALLRRKRRVWAILGLRRPGRPFGADDLELLKETARILSSHLDRYDRDRAVAMREKIDRKLIEPIRPIDLFYQVLHGLRSLTGYDHSASLYMPVDPLPLPYRESGDVDVQIVAELLARRAKSPRVGQECALDPSVVALLENDRLLVCRRESDGWRTHSGRPGADLSCALDSGENLGEYGRERSMIVAPLISENRLRGILKIGFRHAVSAGRYEADLVRDFVPHVIVALRNLRRLEHLKDELDAARRFQISLLPPLRHAAAGATIVYRYRPCDQLGGDFFDVAFPADGRTQILLADVSGHGAKAAMVTALIKATFRDKGRSADPAAILREIWINMRYLDPELMVTAICLEIDRDAGVLLWANAGHPPPLLRSPGGEVERIEEGDPPLFGGAEFRRQLHARQLPEAGARLLLTTDGLVEAEAGDGDEFGEERLAEVAFGAAADAADGLDALYRAVDAHRRGSPQADDWTAAFVTFEE